MMIIVMSWWDGVHEVDGGDDSSDDDDYVIKWCDFISDDSSDDYTDVGVGVMVVMVMLIKVVMMEQLVNITPAHSMFVPRAVGVKVTFLCLHTRCSYCTSIERGSVSPLEDGGV